MPLQCVFFIGKGGVGKSTSAALTGLRLVQSGKKVLLVSLDPAHNLSDIFEIPSSEKHVSIIPDLFLSEIDSETWIKKYLKKIKEEIRESYAYLTAFNLEHYFDLIRFSPGIEEYALFMSYRSIIEANSKYNTIIFDMPPTALTLKFFSLPWLSLQWLEKLSELRIEILKKREIISRIKLGKKELESDKIQNKLQNQISDYQKAQRTFINPDQSQINLVLNPDTLSLKESKRIYTELKRLELNISRLVLNMSEQDINFKTDNILSRIPICHQSRSTFNLIGLENLKRYLHENPAN